jgi:hypothetical protein
MSKLPAVPAKKSKLPAVQLPAVANGQLPVVAKAFHPVRALRDFANRADDLLDCSDRVMKMRSQLRSVRQCPHASNAQKLFEEAANVLDDSEGTRELLQELRVEAQKFDPPDATDDDYCILEEVVRTHVALLLASFPNAKPGNEEVYVGMMVEHVLAENPSPVVLESACAQIRKSAKFPPTTAEVIEAINEQKKLWGPRLVAIDYFELRVESLRSELAVTTELVAAAKVKNEERMRAVEEKKRIDDALRAQPVAVGDRVHCCSNGSLGAGTIIEADSSWMRENPGFNVIFDSANVYFCETTDLERMIPGDHNFKIAEPKRAAVEKALELRAEAERVRTKLMADELERKRTRPPLNIGDRVWSVHGGWGGTVIDNGVGDVYGVRIDGGEERDVHRNYLERQPAGPDCGGKAAPNVSIDFPIDPAADDEEPPRSYFGGRLQP